MGGLKEGRRQKRESMNKNRMEAERGRAGHVTAKSISIKGAKRKSGDCAPKAAELTSGDLPPCPACSGLDGPEGALIERQKSAEGIVARDVGEAREALRPKGGAMDRPIRKRGNEGLNGKSGKRA